MEMLAPGVLAKVCDAIKEAIGGPRYDLWFQGNTKLTLQGQTLEIGVPNRFYREWMESHFHQEISRAVQDTLGDSLLVQFHIDPSLFRLVHTQKAAELPAVPAARPKPSPLPKRPSRFSLSRIVVGAPNRVAHAAASAIIEDPRRSYSPLLIQGAVGLGKSHLLKGIAEGIRARHPLLKVLELSCEEFGNEFVEALRTGKLGSLRRRLRQLDVLLVDDVQFLCNKRATQEEFLHTLNTLEGRGAAVVLTCDIHPRRFKIREELKTRFVAGMVAKIDPPNREMRRQIVRDKAAARHFHLDGAIVDFLADNLRSNVCELEGAINYLQHYSETMGVPLDESSARAALADILRHSVPVLRISEVRKKACELFGINPKILLQKSRMRAVAHPRMLVLYLARKYTHATYSEIGQQIGRLNHSTVIAAEKKIDAEISRDSEIVLGDRPWRVRDAIEAFERELGRS